MTFCDPSIHARHSQRGPGGYATIEVGHAETRTGIIVQVDCVASIGSVRMILERAFDSGGSMRAHRVTDPGWWAALVASAGLMQAGTASIQRTAARASCHAVLVVERGAMIEARPLWPMARLHATGALLDLRGETALAVGPADAELLDYGRRAGTDAPISELLRMFNLGVLEWEAGAPAPGRRRRVISAAG